MEIRDPIHGLIEYNDLEERVMDTRAVQRLRGLHQLAMAYLVYPGALHTRFDHSLGVMHVAGRVARSLHKHHDGDLLSPDEEQDIRLAALLHDIGHGPFSHVSEMPLAELNRKWLQEKGVDPDTLHEQITVDLVENDPELVSILGERRHQVASIIAPSERPSVSQAIISGPLDADKLDYLLRDSHYCGVKYGVYDLDRVLDGLRKITAPSGDSYLGVADESVGAVEQHLMARYQMTLQVYRHRIRRSTDILLSRAIIAAASESEEIHDLYTYGGDKDVFCRRWLAYDDHWLFGAMLAQPKGSEAATLAEALASRRLPLRVLEMQLTDLGIFLQGRLAKPEKRSELEERIAKHLGVPRSLVIVDLVQTNPPRPSSSEPGIDPEGIYVYQEGDEPRGFDRVSDIFKGNPLAGTKRVVVHVPFAARSKADRQKEREWLSAAVKLTMDEWGKEG